MAASANPSGNNHQSANNGGGGVVNNGDSGLGSGRVNSSGMKHNPGIESEWTNSEQSILEDGLLKYASDPNFLRYSKVAMLLPNKTARDVALRCKWMNRKESNKRRKDDHSRKSKDKREKVTESSSKSSQLASRPSSHPYSMPTVSLDNDDGISYSAIGGPTGDLLEQNAQFFQQISSNFSSFQVQENISLFCQVRDNFIKIMNSNSDSPEIMKQMPPLPVKLNEELANSILPPMNINHLGQL